MRISGFIWIGKIVEKLARKHGVRREEVREVFSGHPRFRYVERGHRKGENVYAALGQTDDGRYLTVFFVHKGDERALIVSARSRTNAERRRYGRRS